MSGKGKKAIFCSEAARLYIVELLTLEQIATRLPVTTRTLQTWKKAGRWEEKRAKLAEANDSDTENFLIFRTLLMERVNKKLEAGEDPSASELQTVAKLGTDITKNAYQRELASMIEAAEEAKPEDKEAMSAAALAAVAKFLKEGGL